MGHKGHTECVHVTKGHMGHKGHTECVNVTKGTHGTQGTHPRCKSDKSDTWDTKEKQDTWKHVINGACDAHSTGAHVTLGPHEKWVI